MEKHFHKNPLYFRIDADFEADNQKDNTCIGNKTTNIYKQNPVLNGYHIVSELEDILKSEYHKSPLGYDNVDFDITPKTNEEYISVTYGCIRFIDSYRFLSSGLDSLNKTLVDNSNKTLKNLKKEIDDNDEILKIVIKMEENYPEEIENLEKDDRTIKNLKKYYPEEIKNLEEALLDYIGENDLKILKSGFPDKWLYLTKKLAYPYEYFNSIDHYQKPVDNLKKEDFFSKLEKKCPDDEEIERTMDIIKKFNIKNGEELTEICV